MPPAKNLNELPPSPSLGLKPLPKLAPSRDTPLGADENPFTLPTARGPAVPPAPAPQPPAAKPESPAPAVPAKPKAEPGAKEGLGARFLRTLRGEPSAEPTNAAIPEAPPEPEEKKGFSLPAARIVEPDPAVAPPEPEQEPAPVAEPAPVVGELPALLETPVFPEAAPAPEAVPDVEIVEETPPLLPPAPTAQAPKPDVRAPEPAAPRAEPPAASLPSAAPSPRAPDPIPELESLSDPLAGADLLPPGPAYVPYSPPPEAAAAPPAAATSPAPVPTAAAPAAARNSPVYIAAVAGAALGTVSVLAVYLLLRNDASSTARPAADPPFARGTGAPGAAATPPAAAVPTAPAAVTPAPGPVSPAPVVGNPDVPLPKTIGVPSSQGGPISVPPPSPVPGPAPKASPEAEAGRPAATFAVAPRVVVVGQEPAPKSKSKPRAQPAADDETPDEAEAVPAAKPVRRAASEPAAARKPKGPGWAFEGVVFDLLTARGVFAAKLIFLDPDGSQAGTTETGPGGRYKIQLPVLSGGGYSMKISHQDYTEHYIDEGDATSSLREATPEERKILMSAASRNLPWVGSVKKAMHRDLALVPRSPEEP